MSSNIRVTAIVQARMGSSRLPGKVMADVAGKPLIAHVVARTRAARLVDNVGVATSTAPEDDALAGYCAMAGIPCFRGPLDDVLSRYAEAARSFGGDAIVRITADCPLIDPEVIDRVVGDYLQGGADFVTNTLIYTYPDGLDVEVFSVDALGEAAANAISPSDREHVTPYIRTNPKFVKRNVTAPEEIPTEELRLTVDRASDLALVREIYARLGNRTRFGYRDIVKLYHAEPELFSMNHDHVRNEGYYRSIADAPPTPPSNRTLAQSEKLREKAKRLIPSGAQTFSKSPSQFVQGAAPNYLDRADGCRVWDVDDNAYIEYSMGLGPVILGHRFPAVDAAVKEQLEKGVTFSLPHRLEVEVAALVADLVPCAEAVRFGKNGSDATSGAVRAARAFTGREIVACCGYHGWQDWFIGTTTRRAGVPKAVQELTVPFAYNDVSSLEAIFRDNPGNVACVIMEPVGVVDPEQGFLEAVRDICRKQGALLVFDEVVTGFRANLGGAQKLYGVTPDLACFGKGMANGYPLSCVAGRRDVMEVFDTIFYSFTFGGEALSLAACKATLLFMSETDVIAKLWESGLRLKDGYNFLSRHYGLEQVTECIGLPPRTVVTFVEGGEESRERFSLFQQECFKRGVLFTGGHNLCFSHEEGDIDQTLKVYRTALEIVAGAIAAGEVEKRLDGDPVQPIFRRA